MLNVEVDGSKHKCGVGKDGLFFFYTRPPLTALEIKPQLNQR